MDTYKHSHGMTDPGHAHSIARHSGDPGHEHCISDPDGPYMGEHLLDNCRCSIAAINPEVMKAARVESEYCLTVRLDPATIDALMDEMRKTIAAAFGLKPEMLFGGEPPPPVSQEFRALMTVAAFPHTPE